jgi:hypothetical protein
MIWYLIYYFNYIFYVDKLFKSLFFIIRDN